MGILLKLSELALKQMMGDGAEKIVGWVRDHFTDQGQKVREALNKANKRAWQTLEIALAGSSWWDQVKNTLAPSEEKAFAGELQAFLAATPMAELTGYDPFRKQCISELRQARKQGIIPGGQLSADEVKRQPAGWGRHAGAQEIQTAEATLAGIARELEQQKFSSLAKLVVLRPHGGQPLLVLAVRYFFRREVATDPQLFQGLVFEQMTALSQAQVDGFKNLDDALAKHGQRVEDLIGGLTIIKEGVLNIQVELQRVGKALQAETRAIFQAVTKMLEERQMNARPVQPRDSLSIRTDQERELVKGLLHRYRGLPEGQRVATPALLNGVSQLVLAAGDPLNAQRGFAAVASLTNDPRAQAEAHYNAYRAALVGGRNDEAWPELQQALVRDPVRFAPFPLDQYEPLSILGAGGFGVTFLCRHKLMGNKLAVKALVREDLERNVSSVFQEATLLDQLHHPAIIQLKHCGYADAAQTRPYVAMEYFEGQTLEQSVRINGPLPWPDFKDVALKVAGGLAAAHEKKILHRDVKPANLLLRKMNFRWEVRLIDFGLALNQAAIDAASTIKQGYGMTGTLDYAAPEQLGKVIGVQIGPPADVYGFARTCCFALFGTAQPSHKHWLMVSPGMRKLLDDCLAEKPTDRLQSFAAVLERLPGVHGPRRPRNPAGETAEPEPAWPKAQPRLVVQRGLMREVVYPLHEGTNFVGRFGESPVDVNLQIQEPRERVQSSQRHAVIIRADDTLTIEDLNSPNGTFVNRARLTPGQKYPLIDKDVIQIGSIHLQFRAGI